MLSYYKPVIIFICSRSEIALKLQEELVLYQKDTLSAETDAVAAQQVRALSYGLGNMGGMLGRAVHVQGPIDRPLQEYFHYDRGDPSTSMVHSASSPAVRTHSIDDYIASPSRFAATSSERRVARLQSEPESNIAAALRRGFPSPSSTVDPNGTSITGSTMMPNGLHLHHNIRIVDDSDGEADSTEDSSASEETQRMYQAANQAHLAQFGLGGVGASSTPSHSTDVGRMDSSSEAIMREFNRSLHTELGLTNDQMPRAERNLINSHMEGHNSAQLLNNMINGPFSQRPGAESHRTPTWREEMDGILTSAGLSSSISSSAINSAVRNTSSEPPLRSAQMAAINSYMSNDTASRFNALNSHNSTSAGSSYTPTTYQIRATGDGSFMTVPVVHTPAADRNNSGDLER